MSGPILLDRVMETSTTTGTGTLTLAGAVLGYAAWSGVGNANTAAYCIYAVDANGNPSGAWEVGIGTYTAAGTTLARTTFLGSSTGSAVNFGAGTKRVALVSPAYLAGPSSIGMILPDRTGATDCAAKLTAAIALAKALGVNEVFVPSGTYLLHTTVTLDPAVKIRGAGRNPTLGTKFLSDAATTMFDVPNVALTQGHASWLEDLACDGNGIGTVGVRLKGIAWTGLKCVRIQKFTSICLHIEGAITCTFDRVQLGDELAITKSAYALFMETGAGVPCNLVAFNFCQISAATSFGALLVGVTHVTFTDCEHAFNGTNADASTGAVQVFGPGEGGNGPCVTYRGGWWEANLGNSCVEGYQPNGGAATECTLIMENCRTNDNTVSYDVYIAGNGTRKLHLDTKNCTFTSGSAKNVKLGAGAARWTRRATVAAVVDTAAGSYLDYPAAA